MNSLSFCLFGQFLSLFHSFLKDNFAVHSVLFGSLGFLFVCFTFSTLNIPSDSLLDYKVSASLAGAGVGWLWGPW